MKRALDLLFLLASLTFIFWPWGMAIGTAVYWFFGMPPFFEWDADRWGFALVWPFAAFFVWLFLLYLFSSFTEDWSRPSWPSSRRAGSNPTPPEGAVKPTAPPNPPPPRDIRGRRTA